MSTAWIIGAQTKAKPVVPKWSGITYLQDQQTTDGEVSVKKFIELISKPIYVKDNRDNKFYTVNSFTITFGERGLYEDEAGKPMIVTDYLTRRCTDQVDTAMLKELRFRAKPGDTAYIENVMFRNENFKDKFSQEAQPIKIILTK
ncbi:MAG: hypothetical protein BGO31_17430 [Bacteroidetes bacterium 43-16]|nr:MAG: hypothetical protein BGO31_17430 [Bacteroidetes bacterium 43-16]